MIYPSKAQRLQAMKVHSTMSNEVVVASVEVPLLSSLPTNKPEPTSSWFTPKDKPKPTPVPTVKSKDLKEGDIVIVEGTQKVRVIKVRSQEDEGIGSYGVSMMLVLGQGVGGVFHNASTTFSIPSNTDVAIVKVSQ